MADTIVTYEIILILGLFVALKLFYTYPRVGYLWFVLWAALFLAAVLLAKYRHRRRRLRKL